MEVNDIIKKSVKAQLMTIIVLVIFLLMFAELFTFALLNISSNNLAQTLTVASSSSNYGNLLRLSAASFAKDSASRALLTLANYEYNPALRKNNFITNFTFYVSNLIVSGVLPNDVSGYPQNMMGDLTLANYNSLIIGLFNFAPNSISITETRPAVFQTDPYHLRVSYTENVTISASGSIYNYNIPVNVSIPLDSSPDLFYAQQGILKPIRFANLSDATALIGNTYAISGNTIGYVYGVVNAIPSSATSAASCPSSPPSFSKSLIIVTFNAINLGSGCSSIASYGGLITYNAPSSSPPIPYLVYSSSANILPSLPSGMSVLLYGPGRSTLNIENLRNDIMNEYYFASPFTPSYIDRANSNLLGQSPNGVFTFSNYDTQAAAFNGLSSYISVSNIGVSGDWTATLWATVNTVAPTIQYPVGFDSNNGIFMASASASRDLGVNVGASTLYGNVVSPNMWYHIAVTKSGATYTLYVNGSAVNSMTMASIPISNLNIGRNSVTSGYLSGSIANIQVYSQSLSGMQIAQLYQEGITGLPVSNNALAGWWPLNGNANDYSGNANNGIATNTAYGLLQNYTRDSVFSVPVNTPLSPIPGVMSCNNNAQCASNSLPHLYLGYTPLEFQNGFLRVGNFDGQVSNVVVSTSQLISGNQITMIVWADKLGPGKNVPRGFMLSQGTTYLDTCHSSSPDFSVKTDSGQVFAEGGSCPAIGQWIQYAGTYNGVAATLYINGVAVSSIAQTGNLMSGQMAVGVCVPCDYYFNGLIANAQVYRTALSNTMIQQLYQEGIAGLPFFSNSLAGWWPLNGNANDYSGIGGSSVPVNVVYPYFSGAYNSPGLSSVVTTANEWEALGLANT